MTENTGSPFTAPKRTSMTGCMIAGIVAAGLAVLGLILLITVVSSFNRYTRLEVKAAACQTDNTNVLDNTRKSIRECSAVSDKEVDALVSIITGNSEARGKTTAGSGAMVTVGVVHEAVPSITEVKTLNKLMNIIVAGRKDWQNAQTRLIEVKKEGDEAIGTLPGNMVLGLLGKKPINITVVTSSETQENFKTGRDDGQWVEPKSKKGEK